MKEKQRKYSSFAIIFRAISIQFKSTPLLTTICILTPISTALMFTASVVVTQAFFDVIIQAEAGQITFASCLAPLMALVTLTLGQQIIQGVDKFLNTLLTGKSIGKIKALFNHKLQNIDPALFEKTDFLNNLEKAKGGISQITSFSLIPFTIFSYYGVIFTSIGIYLFQLQPVLILILFVSFIPSFLLQFVRANLYGKLEEQNAPLRREYWYYQKTICDREYLKETRILGAFNYFYTLYKDTVQLLNIKTWQTHKALSLLQLILNISTFIGMAISIYILFESTITGLVTIGAFVAVFNAIRQIFGYMHEIVTGHIGNIYNNIAKVTNFIRILDIPERKGEVGIIDYAKGIEAQNISFTYPGRSEPAVNNLSISISANETIAIVGENGAGKSTLVRLLTGIYLPLEGSITIGGLDTSLYIPVSLHNGISGIFQNYQRYKMTVEKNVIISDLEKEKNGQRTEYALENADMKYDGINLDTMLSPEFDGVDISGGQWQRLAIARGLYRESNFIVLDEPTAAIDPIEETLLYTKFQNLARGKCSIIVTHRLGSVKFANRIIVMGEGRIIDMGTHEELLSRKGKYANMWAAQAKWYTT